MGLDSIKRRREERLRQLRERMKERALHDEFDRMEPEEEQREKRNRGDYLRFSAPVRSRREPIWDDDDGDMGQSETLITSRFMVKVVLSLFLISLTYVAYQTQLPYSQQAKGFISQVMTRDFNFAGVMALAERYVGESPAIFPTFVKKSSDAKPVWKDVDKTPLLAPLQGEIASPFLSDGKGVAISALKSREIKAMDKGWVTFIGQKEGLGQTIVIQHENQVQSWYSNLEQIQVAEKDWVQPGQILALAKEGEPMHFSILEKDQFIDPMSVISFE